MDEKTRSQPIAASQARATLDALEATGAPWPEVRAAVRIYRDALFADTIAYCDRLEARMLKDAPTLAEAEAAEEVASARVDAMVAADDAAIAATRYSHHSDAEWCEAACAKDRAETVHYLLDLQRREDWSAMITKQPRPRRVRYKPKTATRGGVKYPVKD